MSDRSPKLAIIDYGMGNLRSVQKAWEVAGAQAQLIDHPSQAHDADALVFPGQGAIVDTMVRLKQTGFDTLVKNWIAEDRPFFGICLGLQALFDHSEEGDTKGLGIFPGVVSRFRFASTDRHKVPHMGWNSVNFVREAPLLVKADVAEPQFYFVHSYRVESGDPILVWGQTEYGGKLFCSAIQHGNCYATQFHPEKSQQVGLDLYRSFLQTL